MALSRRAFLAAAAAGLAACSKTAHKVIGTSKSTTTGAPATEPPTTRHTGASELFYSGPRDRKMVAFTFHGSGALNLTQQMLALTKQHSAPITIFAVGTWLQQNPSIAHQILDAGHELENHTYTHPQLRGAGAATISREVIGCRDVLKTQTGTGGTYFRPSGMEGNYPPVVMEEAGLAGYPVVCGFDVDPSDYLDPGAAAIEARVKAALKPGSIVSLHLGHAGTVTAFPTLVADARAKGLEPVLVRDLLA